MTHCIVSFPVCLENRFFHIESVSAHDMLIRFALFKKKMHVVESIRFACGEKGPRFDQWSPL